MKSTPTDTLKPKTKKSPRPSPDHLSSTFDMSDTITPTTPTGNSKPVKAKSLKPMKTKKKDLVETETNDTSNEDEIKVVKKVGMKNVPYTDDDGTLVPKRKVKYSRVFDVYCVRHNAEILIDDHKTICVTGWTPQAVAREFCVSELEKIKKVTGRRDIYVKERSVEKIQTYGYVVRRKRVEEKDIKKVQFPGKSETPATFNFNTKINHARINKTHLRSFRQQCMKRMGASNEEIEGVPLEADKSFSEPESDSEDEEDAPEPKVKAMKKKAEDKVEVVSQQPITQDAAPTETVQIPKKTVKVKKTKKANDVAEHADI